MTKKKTTPEISAALQSVVDLAETLPKPSRLERARLLVVLASAYEEACRRDALAELVASMTKTK